MTLAAWGRNVVQIGASDRSLRRHTRGHSLSTQAPVGNAAKKRQQRCALGEQMAVPSRLYGAENALRCCVCGEKMCEKDGRWGCPR